MKVLTIINSVVLAGIVGWFIWQGLIDPIFYTDRSEIPYNNGVTTFCPDPADLPEYLVPGPDCP